MNARTLGLRQADAAFVADISERTVQRIEAGTHQPDRGAPPKHTNPRDPLKGIWEEELEPMLRGEPRLKAMTLTSDKVLHFSLVANLQSEHIERNRGFRGTGSSCDGRVEARAILLKGN